MSVTTLNALEIGDEEQACSQLTTRGQQALVEDANIEHAAATCEEAAGAYLLRRVDGEWLVDLPGCVN
jgi:hypothetical protein